MSKKLKKALLSIKNAEKGVGTGDIKKKVLWYLKKNPNAKTREVAEAVGTSKAYVYQIKTKSSKTSKKRYGTVTKGQSEWSLSKQKYTKKQVDELGHVGVEVGGSWRILFRDGNALSSQLN